VTTQFEEKNARGARYGVEAGIAGEKSGDAIGFHTPFAICE
jgi:hypothetical protein